MPFFSKNSQKIISTQNIELAGEVVEVKITLTRRRSYAIIVSPNMQVEVKAPLRSRQDWLLARVKEREGWIIKHREKFRKRPGAAKPKQYAEGEMFCYMGTQYKVRLTGIPGAVNINGEYIDIGTRNKTPTAVKAALKFWYNETAKALFNERLPICLQMVEGLKLPKYKKIDVKLMKGRWGSCGSNREIKLNPELIAAPLSCIDYVIVHELCHLREHNHGPRFYKLMTLAMPDWKLRRKLLNSTTEVRFL